MKKTEAYWDSSALVPLCVAQDSSRLARTALRNWSPVVWWSAPVEMTSAFCRLLRQRDIDERHFGLALSRLASLRETWVEVLPAERIRQLAVNVLQMHTLRAADALQLAAALFWSREQPRHRLFFCGDARLAEAAAKVGFQAEIV